MEGHPPAAPYPQLAQPPLRPDCRHPCSRDGDRPDVPLLPWDVCPAFCVCFLRIGWPLPTTASAGLGWAGWGRALSSLPCGSCGRPTATWGATGRLLLRSRKEQSLGDKRGLQRHPPPNLRRRHAVGDYPGPDALQLAGRFWRVWRFICRST